MSHNPNRAMGRNNRRMARRNDPHIGHKRSRGGGGPQGVDLADLQNRQTTLRGWMIPYFKGDDFEMIYELIAARNATGLIKHPEADRVIRVLRGILYVLQDGEIITVREGQVYSAARGTEYELSSDVASDVELLICQGSGYEEGIEVIRESDTRNMTPKTVIPKQQEPVEKREPTGKAMEAAQKIAAEKMRRQAARNPAKKKGQSQALTGQNEPGVNLRPMGDPGPSGSE